MDIYIGIVGHFWTIHSILCISKKFTNSVNQRSNTKKQITIKMKSCNEMNMSIEFKKFYNKILLDMKTFEVTIDHILVYFIGSKLGLYVSFLISLYEKTCSEISTLSKSPFCKSLPKQTTNNRLKHINILD